MNAVRMMGLTFLTLLSVVPFAKPLPPTVSIHSYHENITYGFSVSNATTPITLSFNLTGHDPGSDSLELNLYVVTGSFYCGACDLNMALTNSSIGAYLSNIVATSPCTTNSMPTGDVCATIHYAPITTTHLYLWTPVLVGSSQFIIQGRHSWTVTTIS